MKNIINYAAEASENFQDRAFNAVDSLVLSQFAYLHFDGFVPGIAEAVKPVSIAEISGRDNHDIIFQDTLSSKKNRKLLEALAGSPRFRNVGVTYYVNTIDVQAEKQFSALTYLLDHKRAYIAYRGTDATFVGWKEDFNMAFISPVPSQQEGAAYLNTLGEKISGDLLIGGHSKGGNIAIYSAINCNSSVQNKITHVFSHDAPGFRKEVLSSGDYLNMRDRIYNTIPQSSVIGMLLQHCGNYSVVKSNRLGILQHDPYSWLIDNDDFQYVQRVNNSAIFKNKTLDDWLNALDDKKRKVFIDTLYQVVKASEAETYFDLTEDWRKRAVAVLEAIKDIDEETRKFVRQTIGALLGYALKNLLEIHDSR